VIELIRYRQEDGHEPYTEWFRNLRDQIAKNRIAARLRQIPSENFGDCKPVGEGVIELRTMLALVIEPTAGDTGRIG
jgi:putative addiction module killer protein